MTRPDPASPASQQPAGQPLASVAAGQRVRVLDLDVDQGVARRLAYDRSPLAVAAVIVAARGSRLALGRPLAATITVAIDSEEAAE